MIFQHCVIKLYDFQASNPPVKSTLRNALEPAPQVHATDLSNVSSTTRTPKSASNSPTLDAEETAITTSLVRLVRIVVLHHQLDYQSARLESH